MPKTNITFNTKSKAILFGAILLFEIIHVLILFGGAEILAGGDNINYLGLRENTVDPYMWSNSVPFGGINRSIADLFGLPTYALLTHLFSITVVQALIILVFTFIKYVGFYKLLGLFTDRKLSALFVVPPMLIYVLSAFSALNPYSFITLAYNAYLPLSLYYFIQLVDSSKLPSRNIAVLVLLSFVFSPVNTNLPLSSTIFIPQFLYLIVSLKKIERHVFYNIALYYLLLIITNLWWSYPLVAFYLQTSNGILSSESWYTFTEVGSLFQNFRFIGQWGWYVEYYLYPYYPFNTYYDNPFVVFSTFSIVIIAFVEAIRRLSGHLTGKNLYLLLLAVFSIFLMNGARPPFGFVYRYMFEHIVILRIFREPFTKFTELYVLAIALLFGLFLQNITLISVSKNKKNLILCLSFLVVLLSVKPVLFGQHVWKEWNANMRTNRVEIPDYWNEFSDYAQHELQNSRLITLPKVNYGTAWNWPRGFASADDIAVSFLPESANLLREPLNYSGDPAYLINNIYDMSKSEQKYLGLLGISHVLRQNDIDWRYSGTTTLPPHSIDIQARMSGLHTEKQFGNLDTGYLSMLPDNSLDIGHNRELLYELEGRPPIVLYRLDEENINPKIYAADKIVFADTLITDLPYVVGFDQVGVKNAVLVKNEDDGSILPTPEKIKDFGPDVYIIAKRNISELDYNSETWNETWSWPDVSVDPATTEYRLVLIKERLGSWRSGSDLTSLVEIKTVSLANRAMEVYKFKPADKVLDKVVAQYIKDVAIMIDAYKKVTPEQRDARYFNLLKKSLSYMRRSSQVFEQAGFEGSSGITPAGLYEDFLAWAQAETELKCEGFCYNFDNLYSGTYEAYIDTKSADLYGIGSGFVPRVMNEENSLVQPLAAAQKDDAEWTYFGSYFLDTQSYTMEFDKPAQESLLNKEEWKEYAYEFDERFESSQILTWDALIQYKSIDQWIPGENYRISFNYSVENGGLGLSVLESVPSYVEKYTDLSSTDVLKREVFSEILDKNSSYKSKQSCREDGQCFYRFERTVTAGPSAVGADLLVFDAPKNIKPKSFFIDDVRVEKVGEPKFIFRATNLNTISTPSISFQRKDPTNYDISVAGADEPFWLIFNDSYNKDWKLSFEERTISGSEHYKVNGYGNTWLIDPSDVGNNDFTLQLSYTPQDTFVLLLSISLFINIAFLILLLYHKLKYVYR